MSLWPKCTLKFEVMAPKCYICLVTMHDISLNPYLPWGLLRGVSGGPCIIFWHLTHFMGPPEAPSIGPMANKGSGICHALLPRVCNTLEPLLQTWVYILVIETRQIRWKPQIDHSQNVQTPSDPLYRTPCICYTETCMCSTIWRRACVLWCRDLHVF